MANGIVLNIDTTKSEFQNPMIELRQGDGNYQSLDVTVTSNGSPFNLTGWTITFMGTTAGGFKIVDTAVSNVDTANGKFTYTPTKAWGQDEGMFKEAYFKFTSGANGNSVASGASLRVNVLTAVDLTASEAGDYISVVDQTIAKLNGNLKTLQSSVDQLNAQNLSIKTSNNTWTGVNVFEQPIDGYAKVKTSPSNDLNLIINPGKYQLWVGSSYTNVPSGGIPNEAILIVETNVVSGIIYQYILSRDPASPNNDMTIFFRANASNSWSAWKQVAKNDEVVHKTGNETIRDTKIFTSPVYGSLATRRDFFTSFATVANNMQTYAGYSFSGTGYITDMPLQGFAMISVQPNENSNNSGSITLIYTTIKATVHGHVNSGVITWEVSADDALVAHKSGAETITGAKTFTGVQTFSQPIMGAMSVAMVPSGITTIVGLVSRALTDFGGNSNLFSINYVSIGQSFTDAPNTSEQYYKITLVSRGSARTYVNVVGLDSVSKNASVSNGVLTAWV